MLGSLLAVKEHGYVECSLGVTYAEEVRGDVTMGGRRKCKTGVDSYKRGANTQRSYVGLYCSHRTLTSFEICLTTFSMFQAIAPND